MLDLVPAEPRVFPVGRLDYDTEGLLLLTNDGDLAHRLTHPSFGIEKEYLAEVEGEPSRGDAAPAPRRVSSSTTARTAPARVAAVSPSVVRITIHEGRNRQVRRMFDAVGHPVRRLVRTRIGPLADRGLEPGGVARAHPVDEVRALERAVGRRGPSWTMSCARLPSGSATTRVADVRVAAANVVGAAPRRHPPGVRLTGRAGAAHGGLRSPSIVSLVRAGGYSPSPVIVTARVAAPARRADRWRGSKRAGRRRRGSGPPR